MPHFSRRQFLHAAGASTALLMMPAWLARAAEGRRVGPNGTIRLGFIGIRGRGNQLLASFRNLRGVTVAALCDVDSAVLGQRMADARKLGESPRAYGDPRQVFDDASVDAVVIATPNHTHALLAIWAMQAGKDVYVEKPVSHNVHEGRQLVNAARKYSKIVQAGTQNRSDIGLIAAFAALHAGEFGALKSVHGLCYKPRKSIGKRATPLTPPSTLNHDLWLGPAQDLPVYREQFHYDWHWCWNTGNGDVGNQGAHELDMMGWALKEPGMPRAAFSIGGRYGWNDGGETPNVLASFFDCGNGIPVCFEVRNWVPKKAANFHGVNAAAVILATEHGELRAQRGGAVFVDGAGKEVKRFKGDAGATHQANFIAALRAGSNQGLKAEVERNHFAAAMAHLANASLRTGKAGTLAEAQVLAAKMPGLSEHLDSMATNLTGHGIDLAKPTLGIGALLTVDPAREQVVGEHAAAANPLLTRDYRKGYELPNIG